MTYEDLVAALERQLDGLKMDGKLCRFGKSDDGYVAGRIEGLESGLAALREYRREVEWLLRGLDSEEAA